MTEEVITRDNQLYCGLLLEEYKALRSEIAARSAARAAIVSLNLTAIAAVSALFSYVKDGRVFFLIPVIASVLGAIYTDHAINIGKIGRFIRWQVKPRLAEASGVESLLDYEVYVHNYVETQPARRHLLPLAMISIFVVIPLLAIIAPFLYPGDPALRVVPEWRNLLAAAPGSVLLGWFLLLYFPAHYGGTTEMSMRPTGVVQVRSTDYQYSERAPGGTP